VNPIADYLEQLSARLPRTRRRRILAEVRAHLLEDVAASPWSHGDPDRAARQAVERFGPPAHIASQFNAVPRRPRALAQRVTAVLLASTAMATLGTATVWAIEPGSTQSRAHHQGHVQTQRTERHR
jgi:hypothetical protein